MKLRDDTVDRTDNALQCAACALGVPVGLVRRAIKEYRDLRPELRKAALLAMKQGAMLVLLMCAVMKGYLCADERLEDFTEEHQWNGDEGPQVDGSDQEGHGTSWSGHTKHDQG